MNFARKQLEKYGWTDGKGLGKNENGISEALKPKLKRSVAGVGHDAAADFTEHWWSALYDKAAGNVQVEQKNGKTKKIKTIDSSEFEITNNTWRINKKPKHLEAEEQYADYFVRKAVLTSGGVKMEKTQDSSEEEAEEKKDVIILTDAELFAACEGRTAHKGARHGLKALGKLARIEQQEQELLALSKYKGYSQAKDKTDKLKPSEDSQVVEDTNLNSDTEDRKNKKKKKKKKRCISGDDKTCLTKDIEMAESSDNPMPVVDNHEKVSSDTSNKKDKKLKRKKKKLNQNYENDDVEMVEEVSSICNSSEHKASEKSKNSTNNSKNTKDHLMEPADADSLVHNLSEDIVNIPHIKKSKKKNKNNCE